MNITVNQKPLDFELGADITLSEALGHIQDWAKKQNLFILDYKISPIDQKVKLDHPKDRLKTNEIKNLDVEIGTQIELFCDTINELSQYIDRMGCFLARHIQEKKEIDKNDLDMLQKGLVWVVESVKSILVQLSIKHDKSIENHLKILEKFQSNKIDINNNEEYMQLVEAIAKVKDQMDIWLKVWKFYGANENDLDDLLKDFKKEINKVLSDLEGIVTDLTMGSEAKGIHTIENLVDFLSDGLTILYLSNHFSKEREKLITVLNSLIASLDKNDLVSASDTIDYDLREVLEKISSN